MADTAPKQYRPRDLALIDETLRIMAEHVLEALPEPPVTNAAPLSCAAVAWGPSDGVDRVSLLPDTILRNIVSRLPTKEAARTIVLSTRWRRVWHSVPLSLVDTQLFPCADLAATVSSALAAHPGPFRCVYLTVVPMEEHRTAGIAQWLDVLASKGVKDLILMNPLRNFDLPMCLPFDIFECRTITRLYIGFWDFPNADFLPPAAVFPQLRELGLCSLLMEERDLAFLIERCPVLAKLIVVGNRCPIAVRIRSRSLSCVELCTSILPEICIGHATHLQRLLLWGAWGTSEANIMTSWIKIGDAPNLRCLGFLVPGMHHLVIRNTIIKAGTKASPSTTVPSVQMLAVQLNLGDRSQASILRSFIRCFPNTKTLYVQSTNDGSCQPNLVWEDLEHLECFKHHTKKVVIRGVQGRRGELDFLKFIARSAQVIEKLVVVMANGQLAPAQIGSKLASTLASAKWASNNCNVMVYETSSNHQESTPWCFGRALDLSNEDPFDHFDCVSGKCPCH